MKKHRDSLFNFALALLSALLLVLVFPNLVFADSGQAWLAPLALTPLLASAPNGRLLPPPLTRDGGLLLVLRASHLS